MATQDKTPVSDETLDAMYSRSLDDVPAMPGFPLPKPGVYRLKVQEQGLKDINDSKAHEFKYEVIEVLEEGETQAEDAKSCIPGDQFSQLYFMTTQKAVDFNMGRIIKLLAPVRENFGCRTIPELLQAYVGCEVTAIVKLRQNRQDKTQFYPEVEEIRLD